MRALEKHLNTHTHTDTQIHARTQAREHTEICPLTYIHLRHLKIQIYSVCMFSTYKHRYVLGCPQRDLKFRFLP